MFTMVAQNTRKTISAVAAIAIVSFSGLVLDQAHVAAAPAGTIEVGELTPIGVGGMALAALPEVVVVAKRETAAGASFAATTQLPEIVVVARRVAQLAARSDSDSPSTKVDAEGALLK
jgi:hypothetical protein